MRRGKVGNKLQNSEELIPSLPPTPPFHVELMESLTIHQFGSMIVERADCFLWNKTENKMT